MPSRRMVRFSYRSSLGNTGLDRDSARHAAIVATGVLPQDAGWSAAQPPDPGIAARAASIQLISRPFDLGEYPGPLHIRYRIRAPQLLTKAFGIKDLHGSTTEPGLDCRASH